MAVKLTDLDPGTAQALKSAGKEDPEELRGFTAEQLQQLPGFGPARAQELLDAFAKDAAGEGAGAQEPVSTEEGAAAVAEADGALNLEAGDGAGVDPQASASGVVGPVTTAAQAEADAAAARPTSAMVIEPDEPDPTSSKELAPEPAVPATASLSSAVAEKKGHNRSKESLGRPLPVTNEYIFFGSLTRETPLGVCRLIARTETKARGRMSRAEADGEGAVARLKQSPQYRGYATKIGIALARLRYYYKTEEEFLAVCEKWGFTAFSYFDEMLRFGLRVANPLAVELEEQATS